MMRKVFNNKKTLVIVAALLALTIAVGGYGLYASLKDTAGTVTEELNTADVTCKVNDDYSVTNTSNIPALIRVRVVVNNTENGEIIPGDTPAYTAGSDWTEIGEYLYYNGILTEKDAGGDTTSASVSIDLGGAQAVVLAEAIQAASAAAQEEWGVAYSNGSWS